MCENSYAKKCQLSRRTIWMNCEIKAKHFWRYHASVPQEKCSVTWETVLCLILWRLKLGSNGLRPNVQILQSKIACNTAVSVDLVQSCCSFRGSDRDGVYNSSQSWRTDKWWRWALMGRVTKAHTYQWEGHLLINIKSKWNLFTWDMLLILQV